MQELYSTYVSIQGHMQGLYSTRVCTTTQLVSHAAVVLMQLRDSS